MDFKSAAGFAEQRVAIDAERASVEVAFDTQIAAIDAAASELKPEHTELGEGLTPHGHFTRLFDQVGERIGLTGGFHAGGRLEVTGRTESGIPISVQLTVKTPRTGGGTPIDTRTLEAQWLERGEPIGPREFASAKTSTEMADNPHVLQDLARLEESVTAAAELMDGDESSRKVIVTPFKRRV